MKEEKESMSDPCAAKEWGWSSASTGQRTEAESAHTSEKWLGHRALFSHRVQGPMFRVLLEANKRPFFFQNRAHTGLQGVLC